MMRANRHSDQRRRRERRRLARIAVLTKAEAGLSPTSLFNAAATWPPRPEEERRGRRAPLPTFAEPVWAAGEKVHWYGYIGMFLRDTDDGTAEYRSGRGPTGFAEPSCDPRRAAILVGQAARAGYTLHPRVSGRVGRRMYPWSSLKSWTERCRN